MPSGWAQADRVAEEKGGAQATGTVESFLPVAGERTVGGTKQEGGEEEGERVDSTVTIERR